jgi:hypothetical protein
MQYCLVLLTLFAFSNCAPLDNTITFKSYTNELERDLYRFSYTLSDDQSRFEEGMQGENGSYSVTGFYKFRGTDGKVYAVNYIANSKVGYRATVTSKKSVFQISVMIFLHEFFCSA